MMISCMVMLYVDSKALVMTQSTLLLCPLTMWKKATLKSTEARSSSADGSPEGTAPLEGHRHLAATIVLVQLSL